MRIIVPRSVERQRVTGKSVLVYCAVKLVLCAPMARLVFILFLFLASCSHFRMLPYLLDSDPSPEEQKRQNAILRGEGLFHEFCGGCHTLYHGPAKRARYKGIVPPPSLAQVAKEKSMNVFVARTAIGKGEGMIGFSSHLTDREMWDIAHYVYHQKDLF